MPNTTPTRLALLHGVSLTALLVAAPARAGSAYKSLSQALASASRAAQAAMSPAAGITASAHAALGAQNLVRATARYHSLSAALASAAKAGSTGPSPVVVDGYGPGRGLQAAPGAASGNTLWQGALTPDDPANPGGIASSPSGVSVTVKQTAPVARLTWQSFNVGAHTTLNFDQSRGGNLASSWVAINTVADPTANPAQILGAIHAQGKVYVLDVNGIAFGAGSTVNVGSLIAATSVIAPTQFGADAAGNISFNLYGAQLVGTDPVTQLKSYYAPTFINGTANPITVDAGASIQTAAPTGTNAGGYVMLLGGNVANAGLIATPQGQTVLAAGRAFTLRQGFAGSVTSGNILSTTLGSEVAASNAGTAGVFTTGSVANSGIVVADQGDISFVGHALTQSGVLLSTTTVNTRGTIHFLTPTDGSDPTASVTLAANSVTEIQPEDNGQTELDSARAANVANSITANAARAVSGFINATTNPQLNNHDLLPDQLGESRVEISTYGSVAIGAGALVQAQGGQIAVGAGSQLTLAPGATLDVSGTTNALLPASINSLLVNVQPFQLSESASNRTGGLKGTNVHVDARTLVEIASGAYAGNIYTPGGLLQVGGFLGQVPHRIEELTAIGGQVTLQAQTSISLNGTITTSLGTIVTDPGSVINLQGGAVGYAAGAVPQSYVQTTDGVIYNVDTAPANLVYSGVYTGFTVDHARWHVTNVYDNPLVTPATLTDPGYTVGRDAGSLTLTGATEQIAGSIYAGVTLGQNQTGPRPASVNDPYLLAQTVVPQSGALLVGNYQTGQLQLTPVPSPVSIEPIPAGAMPVQGSITVDSNALNASALAKFTLSTSGNITVSAPLAVADGGTLSLTGANIAIDASLTARSGAIILTDQNGLQGPVGTATSVTLTPGVVLDARGVFTNAQLDPNRLAGLGHANGGNVSIITAGSVDLPSGARIDVSSGGGFLAGGAMQAAAGGSVTVQADAVLVSGVPRTAPVTLDASFVGYGNTGGGTLTVSAPDFEIGTSGLNSTAGTVVNLGSAFFNTGFSRYVVNGIQAVNVLPGAQVTAAEPIYVANGLLNVPTGGDPSQAYAVLLPALYTPSRGSDVLVQRPGGASVSLLSVTDPNDTFISGGGSVTVGAGAQVAVDPRQSITLAGYGQVSVFGTLTAHAGAVNVGNTRVDTFNTASGLQSPTTILSEFQAGVSEWIGPGSLIDVSGQAIVQTDSFGRRFGFVTSGGTIALGGYNPLNAAQSTWAQVILRPGATLDADGAAAPVDVVPNTVESGTISAASHPVTLAGAGGTITARSLSGIALDGTVLAHAGDAQAAGGSLSLTIDPIELAYYANIPTTVFQPREVLVSDQAVAIQPATAQAGDTPPPASYGLARISQQQIDAAGLDAVTLDAVGGGVIFEGNVSLHTARSLTLGTGIVGDTSPYGVVQITSPQVVFSGYTTIVDNGLKDLLPLAPYLASFATLKVSAGLIEIGNMVDLGGSSNVGVNAFPANHPTMPGFGAPLNPVFTSGFGFTTAAFSSTGDIRLLGTTDPSLVAGTLTSIGDYTFTAAQLYPTSGQSEVLLAGLNTEMNGPATLGHTITIQGLGGTAPQAPYSIGGSLTLLADTILQDGVLRAPEGEITLSDGTLNSGLSEPSQVVLGPNSITSVSLAGQSVPYGGTVDGVTYQTPGGTPTLLPPQIVVQTQSLDAQPGAAIDLRGGGTLTGSGFVFGRGGTGDVLTTPLLDINGGLAIANAGAQVTAIKPVRTGDQVYAILPGYQSDYAPAPSASDAPYTPTQTGEQITVAAGEVPGLAAGTYTLLPAYYALQQGGYRVELTSSPQPINTSLYTGNFTTAAPVIISFAGTAISSPTPVGALFTSGTDVRQLSQYDEETYSTFEIAHAALTGTPRPFLPQDAKTLLLRYPSVGSTQTALAIAPANLLKTPDTGGYGATLEIDEQQENLGTVTVPTDLLLAPGNTMTPGVVTLDAATISALDVPRLVIGGTLSVLAPSNTVTITADTASVKVLPYATLSAGDILLTALPSNVGAAGEGAIIVSPKATLTTIGAGPAAYDVTDGYYFTEETVAGNVGPVLNVSAGRQVFLPSPGVNSGASITLGDEAAVLASGSLNFVAPSGTQVDIGAATIGAAYASIAVATINIGTPPSLANEGTNLPPGLDFTPQTLSTLLNGNALAGIPAAQQLALTASSQVNIIGSVQLNTGTTDLVLNTPAIYGAGVTGDVATIAAAAFTWSGLGGGGGSALPGGPIAQKVTGQTSGTLTVLTTGAITLGYGPQTQPNAQTQLDRLITGFSDVVLQSATEITANNKSSLSVYQTQATFGLPGAGGTLTLSAPLVTTDSAAVLSLTGGGAVVLSTPAGLAQASTTGISTLGGEIDIAAPAISLGGAVALPSGRLSLTAGGDLSFLPGSVTDLSGRTVHLLDQTVFSPGGTLVAESTAGNIAVGGLADVSSPGAAAGSLSYSALGTAAAGQTPIGMILLDGTLRGTATAGQTTGGITLLATTLSTTTSAPADDVFGLINAGLNAGGLFGTRIFEIGQLANGAGPGAAATQNVIIGNAADGMPLLIAHDISVTADQGAIDVTGTVDASGTGPGSIALQAHGNVVLDTANGAPALDANATTTAMDSYLQPVDAENRAHVTLTTTNGSLLLQGGTINLGYVNASGQLGYAVGELVLNAPRIGAAPVTGGDVAIDASAPTDIIGASSVALYGWTHYTATDSIGSIAQSTQVDPTVSVTLAAINADNANFINNAGTNTSLTARLAGLIGSNPGTFHLRPGVEIDSSTQSGGNLTIVSDLDLAAGRYSDVGYGTARTGVPGSGEPGSVVFRASNNLIVNGSVTDGFAPPPDIKYPISGDNGWTFGSPSRTDPLSADFFLPSTIVAKVQGGGKVNTIVLGKGTFIDTSRDVSLNYDIVVKSTTIPAGTVIPFGAKLATPVIVPSGGFVATASVMTTTGMEPAGKLLAAGTAITAFSAGAVLPDTATLVTGTRIPAGTPLNLFSSSLVLSQATMPLPVNAFIPANSNPRFEGFLNGNDVTLKSLSLRPDAYHLSGNKAQGYLYALAPLLPAGSLSWNLDFVAGANMNSADVNAVQSRSALAAEPETQPVNAAYQGHGNLILDDQHYLNPPGAGGPVTPAFSVIRTGTGDLSLVAGGNFDQSSLFGIYTAGTQTPPGKGFNLQRAGVVSKKVTGNNLVPGGSSNPINEIFNTYQAFFPNDGGDVVVSAQGSVTGDLFGGNDPKGLLPSDAVGNWLWRQGSAQLGEAGAWWINFGSLAVPYAVGDQSGTYYGNGKTVQLVGFQGIGALGGGNVTITAGLDAGQITDRSGFNQNEYRSEALVIAIGSTGRVLSNGTIELTGGGSLTFQVGGTINPLDAVATSLAGTSATLDGALIDLRGTIDVNAGAIGRIQPVYEGASSGQSPFTPYFTGDDATTSTEGLVLVPGDTAVSINTLRDLVIDGVGDPGRVTEQSLPLADVSRTMTGVATGFTLWTADTSINLWSSGGNVTPTTQPSTVALTDGTTIANDSSTDFRFVDPTRLLVTAASGNIVYGYSSAAANNNQFSLETMPSLNEQVAFLAGQSIFANNFVVDMSGADPGGLSTPFNPTFTTFLSFTKGPNNGRVLATNIRSGGGTEQSPLSLFGQEPDTPTVGYLEGAASVSPALFYAGGGDIVDFITGETITFPLKANEPLAQWYLAAKPVRIEAERDITNSGTRLPPGSAPGSLQQNQQQFAEPMSGLVYLTSGNLFLNNTPQSVSVVSAGRDILDSYFYVGGPGLLEVDAGRNITDLGGAGSIKSLGSLLAGAPISLTGGAGIGVAAGLGTGADYTAFANLYLDLANQANPALQITDPANMGKVQETYGPQLLLWLQQNYGYTGDQAGALAYFLNPANVPAANQDAFLRGVFYNELLASGQQYNDLASRFAGSYVRGRQAIDTLWPGTAGQKSSNGTPKGYAGAITMTSAATTINNQSYTLDAGVATEHGGDIQVLDPGGEVILGTSGSVNPGGGTGLITNGFGNIDVFANGSVLLGKSRIFTNAGGNIQIWSASGDINAGVGARTDVVFTPPVLVYDNIGGIVDSPAVPTSGAGISTQQPLPSIPPGNIDLTAPVGTIDAGEAGVRSSGNVNLAAAFIANGSQIAGAKVTGIVSAPSISASVASAAGAAAGAATNAAKDVTRPRTQAPEPSLIEVDVSVVPETEDEKRRRHHV